MLNANTVQNPFSKDDYQVRYAYTAGGLVEYVGHARPGVAVGTAGWQIQKYTYDANNLVTSRTWAAGDHDYTHVWDDRGTYTYA